MGKRGKIGYMSPTSSFMNTVPCQWIGDKFEFKIVKLPHVADQLFNIVLFCSNLSFGGAM